MCVHACELCVCKWMEVHRHGRPSVLLGRHDCQPKELLLALWLCDGPLVLVNNGQFSASLFVTMM